MFAQSIKLRVKGVARDYYFFFELGAMGRRSVHYKIKPSSQIKGRISNLPVCLIISAINFVK